MSGLLDLTGRPVEQGDYARFLAAYAHLFEHSPWVVERAWDARPFADAKALHAAFLDAVSRASDDEKLGLLRAHPELADKVAVTEGLTAASAKEQASAGLDRLTAEEYGRFHRYNQAYRDRFGFPFIVCVRLHDKATILQCMAKRLKHDEATEFEEALTQVGLIARFRLAAIGAPDGL